MIDSLTLTTSSDKCNTDLSLESYSERRKPPYGSVIRHGSKGICNELDCVENMERHCVTSETM